MKTYKFKFILNVDLCDVDIWPEEDERLEEPTLQDLAEVLNEYCHAEIVENKIYLYDDLSHLIKEWNLGDAFEEAWVEERSIRERICAH